MHSRTDEYLSNKKYKLFIKLMKFATKKGDLFREHKRRNVFLLFFFSLFVMQINCHIISQSLFSSFISILFLNYNKVCSTTATRQDFLIFCFVFQFTSRISSRPKYYYNLDVIPVSIVSYLTISKVTCMF